MKDALRWKVKCERGLSLYTTEGELAYVQGQIYSAEVVNGFCFVFLYGTDSDVGCWLWVSYPPNFGTDDCFYDYFTYHSDDIEYIRQEKIDKVIGDD